MPPIQPTKKESKEKRLAKRVASSSPAKPVNPPLAVNPGSFSPDESAEERLARYNAAHQSLSDWSASAGRIDSIVLSDLRYKINELLELNVDLSPYFLTDTIVEGLHAMRPTRPLAKPEPAK